MLTFRAFGPGDEIPEGGGFDSPQAFAAIVRWAVPGIGGPDAWAIAGYVLRRYAGAETTADVVRDAIREAARALWRVEIADAPAPGRNGP